MNELAKEMAQSFDGAEQEWVDFYNYFKNKKIYVSDMLKADIGKGELSERFSTLIPKDTINAADQLVTVLENIKKVRESIKPVSIESLYGDSASKASDKVWGMTVDSTGQLAEQVKSRLNDALKSADGQLPIEVKINTDKITMDIQKAINKVVELKYNTVKVTLDVDTTGIKDAVTGKLKEIDARQMTSIADGMKQFSDSLRAMGTANYKASGLNAIINSVSRFSQIDILWNFSHLASCICDKLIVTYLAYNHRDSLWLFFCYKIEKSLIIHLF